MFGEAIFLRCGMAGRAMVVWIRAGKNRPRTDMGGNIHTMVGYSDYVCTELGGLYYFPSQLGQIPVGLTQDDWPSHLAALHNLIIDVALVRPLYVPNMTSILGQIERAVLQYWVPTQFYKAPILFF